MRESNNSLKRMDTRLRGYDEFTGLAKVLISKGLIIANFPYRAMTVSAKRILMLAQDH